MFRVGQKVVCVMRMEDQNSERCINYIPNRPVLNGIYTVRGDVCLYDTQYVYLTELINPLPVGFVWVGIGYAEPPFWCGLFRPLVERKTDISIFTKMLNPDHADA